MIFGFGRHHYQSPVIRLCKKLLQDFKLLQALALHTAITRLYALALGEFLNGQCYPPTKKLAHLWLRRMEMTRRYLSQHSIL